MKTINSSSILLMINILLMIHFSIIIADLIPEIEELNDKTELQLKPIVRPNICLADEDCSTISGMVCIDRKCKCKENYFLNLGECLPRTCNDDWQCEGLNGTECSDSYCRCSPFLEYTSRGSCKALRKSCNFDITCPGSSICMLNRCKCKMGSILLAQYESCTVQKCTRNHDCVPWPNTVCDDGRCQCAFGYYLDHVLQKCYPNTRLPSDNRTNFLMQNIFAIVVVCNFFLWISIFILVMQYTRRRRIILATQRASLCTERLPRLPRGVPPPPPSYDYQNYRTQAQLAPPPYSIDDPAKPPEYSTIVTTPNGPVGVTV